jgi:hypothetical protein
MLQLSRKGVVRKSRRRPELLWLIILNGNLLLRLLLLLLLLWRPSNFGMVVEWACGELGRLLQRGEIGIPVKKLTVMLLMCVVVAVLVMVCIQAIAEVTLRRRNSNEMMMVLHTSRLAWESSSRSSGNTGAQTRRIREI